MIVSVHDVVSNDYNTTIKEEQFSFNKEMKRRGKCLLTDSIYLQILFLPKKQINFRDLIHWNGQLVNW